MRFSIDPGLVERVVFEAARADHALRPHYERQFAECHDYRDGQRRERAFARLHERWFEELGLRALMAAAVEEFPFVRHRVARLLVVPSAGPRAQSAELFGAPGDYTVTMAVWPGTLRDAPDFHHWIRHELLHVDDMLNPAFGYDAAQRPSGATSAATHLAQDRYAVLWAISVDARLAARGRAPEDIRERRRAEWRRAFAAPDGGETDRCFDSLWRSAQESLWAHADLLRFSRDGTPGLPTTSGAGAVDHTIAPIAGSACPLCGFRTYDWADRSMADLLAKAIRADFPVWTPTAGLCGRCAEVYRISGPAARSAEIGADVGVVQSAG